MSQKINELCPMFIFKLRGHVCVFVGGKPGANNCKKCQTVRSSTVTNTQNVLIIRNLTTAVSWPYFTDALQSQ